MIHDTPYFEVVTILEENNLLTVGRKNHTGNKSKKRLVCMVVAVVEIHHGDMTGRGDQLEQKKWKMYRVLCMENSELGLSTQMAARTFEITEYE
jgi:hypothetical protein